MFVKREVPCQKHLASVAFQSLPPPPLCPLPLDCHHQPLVQAGPVGVRAICISSERGSQGIQARPEALPVSETPGRAGDCRVPASPL